MNRLKLPLANDAAGDSRSRQTVPKLNVSILAETMFCPRAGLLASRLNEQDHGRDHDSLRSPRWDHLPEFDEREINDALIQRWQEVWTACNILLGLGLGCLAIYFAFDPILAYWLSAAPACVAVWIVSRFPEIAILDIRRRAAARVRAADALCIADLGHEEVTVDYWKLKKWILRDGDDQSTDSREYGVNVYRPVESHHDPQLQLSGRPFLILQYRAFRIPVFLKRRGEHKVFPQHRARIAAYCHLIENSERAQAPFGVVMFPGSYDVVIIPNSSRNQDLFQRGLKQARRVITAADGGTLPEAPAGNECRGCFRGRLRAYRPGVTDSHLAILQCELNTVDCADGRSYHSVCGDCFQWRPPHGQTGMKRDPWGESS